MQINILIVGLNQQMEEKPTLLKIRVLQKVLHSDAKEEPFLVPQRPIQSKDH